VLLSLGPSNLRSVIVQEESIYHVGAGDKGWQASRVPGDTHWAGSLCTAWDICGTSQRLEVKVKIHGNDQEMGGRWVGCWAVTLLLTM
jgi:hypothetical protein